MVAAVMTGGGAAAAHTAAAAAEEAESATRDRLSSSFSLTARRVAAAGGTGALVEAQRNPWNLAALGPPRVAWYRASIRPLLRHCAVHAEVNVLSEDGEGGSGGGRGVRAALRSPPLSAGTAAASAAAAPPSPALWHTTPAVFVRVHADQLSLSLSTGDVVDLANIVLAASVPFAERELQQRQQLLLLRQRQQQAAIERGVGAAASNLAAEVAEEPPASAHRRLFGIRALLFKPFDKLSHSWYGMTDLAAHMPPPEQLLADAAASSGVSRSASSSSSSSSMVGARGAASKQDAQRPQLLPAPARPALSTSSASTTPSVVSSLLSGHAGPWIAMEVSLSAITLRLSHGSSSAAMPPAPAFTTPGGAGSSGGGGGVPRTPFDLVLSCEGVLLSLLVAQLSAAPSVAFHVGVANVMAYAGAGFIPRALLLNCGIKLYGSTGAQKRSSSAHWHVAGAAARTIVGRQRGTAAAPGASSIRPPPHAPTEPASHATTDSATPRPPAARGASLSVTKTVIQIELARAELCLVRRQPDQLAAVDAAVAAQSELKASQAGRPGRSGSSISSSGPRYATGTGSGAALSSPGGGGGSLSGSGSMGGVGYAVTSPSPKTTSTGAVAAPSAGQRGAVMPQQQLMAAAAAVHTAFRAYVAAMADLKTDATYLFAPLYAHVVLSMTKRGGAVAGGGDAPFTPAVTPFTPREETSTPRPDAPFASPATAATATAATTRVILRVGSVILSVSPADAVLLLSLGSALQAGATSIVDDVTRGLEHFLALGASSAGAGGGARPRRRRGTDSSSFNGGGGAEGPSSDDAYDDDDGGDDDDDHFDEEEDDEEGEEGRRASFEGEGSLRSNPLRRGGRRGGGGQQAAASALFDPETARVAAAAFALAGPAAPGAGTGAIRRARRHQASGWTGCCVGVSSSCRPVAQGHWERRPARGCPHRPRCQRGTPCPRAAPAVRPRAGHPVQQRGGRAVGGWRGRRRRRRWGRCGRRPAQLPNAGGAPRLDSGGRPRGCGGGHRRRPRRRVLLQ